MAHQLMRFRAEPAATIEPRRHIVDRCKALHPDQSSHRNYFAHITALMADVVDYNDLFFQRNEFAQQPARPAAPLQAPRPLMPQALLQPPLQPLMPPIELSSANATPLAERAMPQLRRIQPLQPLLRTRDDFNRTFKAATATVQVPQHLKVFADACVGGDDNCMPPLTGANINELANARIRSNLNLLKACEINLAGKGVVEGTDLINHVDLTSLTRMLDVKQGNIVFKKEGIEQNLTLTGGVLAPFNEAYAGVYEMHGVEGSGVPISNVNGTERLSVVFRSAEFTDGQIKTLARVVVVHDSCVQNPESRRAQESSRKFLKQTRDEFLPRGWESITFFCPRPYQSDYALKCYQNTWHRAPRTRQAGEITGKQVTFYARPRATIYRPYPNVSERSETNLLLRNSRFLFYGWHDETFDGQPSTSNPEDLSVLPIAQQRNRTVLRSNVGTIKVESASPFPASRSYYCRGGNQDLSATHAGNIALRSANSLEDLNPDGGAIRKGQKKQPGLSMPDLDLDLSSHSDLTPQGPSSRAPPPRPPPPKPQNMAQTISRLKAEFRPNPEPKVEPEPSPKPKPAPRKLNLKPKVQALFDAASVMKQPVEMLTPVSKKSATGGDITMSTPRTSTAFHSATQPLTPFQHASPAIIDAWNLGSSAPVLTTPERTLLEYFDPEKPAEPFDPNKTTEMPSADWEASGDWGPFDFDIADEEALLESDPETPDKPKQP